MNFSSNTKIRAKKDHLNRGTLFVPFKAPVTTLMPSICKLFITNYYQIQNKARLKETKEIENQPRLINVNLNVILTCNINLSDNILQNHDT